MSVSEEDIALAGEYALGLLDAAEARAFEARLAAEPDLREAYRAFAEEFAALAPPPVTPPADLERRVMAAAFPGRSRRFGFGSRLLGGLAAAAAAVIAAVLIFVEPTDVGAPTLEAELTGEGITLAAFWTPSGGGTLVVERTGDAPPAGRVHELWAIVGGGAPVSLGVLPEGDRPVSVGLPLTTGAEVVLAVSLEPAGGSPTGAPTGPVIGAAPLTPL